MNTIQKLYENWTPVACVLRTEVATTAAKHMSEW